MNEVVVGSIVAGMVLAFWRLFYLTSKINRRLKGIDDQFINYFAEEDALDRRVGEAISVSREALLDVRYVKGVADQLQRAPVLRQYIDRIIPVDNSEERELEIKRKMREMQEEFEGQDLFGDFKPKPKARLIREGDLV